MKYIFAIFLICSSIVGCDSGEKPKATLLIGSEMKAEIMVVGVKSSLVRVDYEGESDNLLRLTIDDRVVVEYGSSEFGAKIVNYENIGLKYRKDGGDGVIDFGVLPKGTHVFSEVGIEEFFQSRCVSEKGVR